MEEGGDPQKDRQGEDKVRKSISCWGMLLWELKLKQKQARSLLRA